MCECSVGAQGRPPQNMSQGHIIFELKLLTKWIMQEEHFDLSFCLPESRK